MSEERKEASAAAEQSLYRAICGALQNDGMLPPDFSLPRPSHQNAEGLRFADGAFDGISLYHMAPDRRDIKSLTEITGLISAGSYDQAAECLRLFFSSDEYICMLPMIDDYQKWLYENRAQIDPDRMLEFASQILMESPDAESIKFVLSYLELLKTDRTPALRNLIRVLALSDEFTLFCLFVIARWPDGNDVIFDIARHVSGWGRIHAVERLAPENAEIRRWLLTEGWQNTVMSAYSALTCVEKSGLVEKIQSGDLSEDEFTAAGCLISALLGEAPVAGIDGLGDQAAPFLAAYLSLAEQRAAAPSDYEAAAALRSYYAVQETPPADLIARAEAILARRG